MFIENMGEAKLVSQMLDEERIVIVEIMLKMAGHELGDFGDYYDNYDNDDADDDGGCFKNREVKCKTK